MTEVSVETCFVNLRVLSFSLKFRDVKIFTSGFSLRHRGVHGNLSETIVSAFVSRGRDQKTRGLIYTDLLVFFFLVFVFVFFFFYEQLLF